MPDNATTLDPLRFEQALNDALASAPLRIEAGRCRARIVLIGSSSAGVGDAGVAAYRHMLWNGAEDGASIGLSAPAEVWDDVFAATPRPGRQSIGALRRLCASFDVIGTDLAFAQALPFIERLIEAVRARYNDLPDPTPLDHAELDSITGSYLRLRNGDWVFTERAGDASMRPLVMLHTAGADARQWHGLMGHPAMRASWSMHAFDLPGHGRSPLPAGEANWSWQLTEDRYVAWVIDYLDAAGLDRVALIGCSMGSAVGLALLARHPERFFGAALLEPPYRSPGRRSAFLDHPEVHGARLSAAWVGSLLSPSSPQARRDQATWIYSQGAPSVYEGDLRFYSDQFDAALHTPRISTNATPLWLLTGDYDYSATCDDARRIAAEVRGAHFIELPGFGHFPMVENPHGLVPLLQPALADLRRFSPSPSKDA